jgi:hypothetical protein
MSRRTASTSALTVSAVFAVTVGIRSIADADPLQNERLKFFQSPLNDAASGV